MTLTRHIPNYRLSVSVGINSAKDALEFILEGATGLQIGTAIFRDPRICKKVIEGLSKWCELNKVKKISDLIGGAHD